MEDIRRWLIKLRYNNLKELYKIERETLLVILEGWIKFKDCCDFSI